MEPFLCTHTIVGLCVQDGEGKTESKEKLPAAERAGAFVLVDKNLIHFIRPDLFQNKSNITVHATCTSLPVELCVSPDLCVCCHFSLALSLCLSLPDTVYVQLVAKRSNLLSR